MKTNRILPVLLAVLLTLLSVPALTASAAGDPKLSVVMPDTIEAGKQLAVSVNIENNPGWSALQFEITYDTTQMELLDVEDGDAMQSDYIIFSYNETPVGTVTVIALYNDAAPTVEESGNMEKDGTWMTLYFAAKSTLAAGTDVAVNVNMSTMCNALLEPQMDPTVVKATAKVGSLSAEDNKTEPSRTKAAVVSGMVGTIPSAVTDSTAADGDTDADSNSDTAADAVTDADTGTDEVSSSVPVLGTILVIVFAVATFVGVIFLIVFFARRK